MKDVGKSKAEVAAERIMKRVQGVTVTPHHCRIEEKPMEFYEQFHILVLGLDSLEARRYMNQVACSFLGECGPASQNRVHCTEQPCTTGELEIVSRGQASMMFYEK